METKQQIRKRAVSKRLCMTREEVSQKSAEIAQRLTAHPWFLAAEHIAVYAAFKNEVDTSEIIHRAWELGKTVYVPRVSKKEMEFFRIQSLEELTAGVFGNPEPEGQEALTVHDERTLVVMPGTAFDKQCHRIGFGGGYYDRYLEKYPRLRTAALAYESQVLETVPFEETDICPGAVVTEETIYRISEGRFGRRAL